MNLFKVMVLVTAGGLMPLSLWAAPRVPLEKGMDYAKVSLFWGAPDAKEELETLRIERWYYRGGEVVFHQGALQSWRSDALPAAPVAKPVSEAQSLAPPKPRQVVVTRGLKENQVQDLLKEVMKDGDSEPAVGGMNSPMNGGFIPPPPPNFLMPTPFGYQGGMPGRLMPGQP